MLKPGADAAEKAEHFTENTFCGKRAEEVSYFSLDRENVILETCKPAFDVENGVVLRLYECMGSAVRCKLTLPPTVKKVWQCNMLEEKQEEVACTGKIAELDFKSFEIKTLLLTV
ncbi:MAG: hypothetical protein K2O03_09400 [Lachnospiraceae bacterium]|nr:hypothetical protein [Lachnospiraceae bacterium]